MISGKGYLCRPNKTRCPFNREWVINASQSWWPASRFTSQVEADGFSERLGHYRYDHTHKTHTALGLGLEMYVANAHVYRSRTNPFQLASKVLADGKCAKISAFAFCLSLPPVSLSPPPFHHHPSPSKYHKNLGATPVATSNCANPPTGLTVHRRYTYHCHVKVRIELAADLEALLTLHLYSFPIRLLHPEGLYFFAFGFWLCIVGVCMGECGGAF